MLNRTHIFNTFACEERMTDNIQIQEYRPSPLLSPFVDAYWQGDFNMRSEGLLSQRVVPNGHVDIIIHLTDLHCDLYHPNGWGQSPDYTIIGLYTRPYEVKFSRRVQVFSIRFKPEGVYNIFGVPASEFKEGFDDMSLVMGRRFRDYCDRLRETTGIRKMIALTEQYLLKSAARNSFNMGYVNRAAEIIRSTGGAVRIDELPRKVFISQRQLEREFKEKIGISPKRYLRLARLAEVHRQMGTGNVPDLSRITYHCGYADQAHFIRDFKSFTGEIPTAFLKQRERFLVNV